MSKPWDKLRTPKLFQKSPLQVGVFTCTDGSKVQWHPVFNEDDEVHAIVWIQDSCISNDGENTSPADLRDIGGFFLELADQLEAK